MNASRNLYALIVGINEYPIPSHRLKGCVNDARAIKQFLETRVDRNEFRLDIKTLFDSQATRLNIIREFEEHLGQAQENDVVFFYYSGHGSQEPAHEAFWHLEPDHMNETLVCWDSRIEDGMDLADKELSTLIEMVSMNNPHVIIIFDCCNSGSGSRDINDALSEEPELEDTLARMVQRMDGTADTYKNPRALDSYILPENADIERAAISTAENDMLIIPETVHIALAASRSDQTAKETSIRGQRRGIFTYSLLEILNNEAHNITYADLMRRVRSKVTNRIHEQDPQLESYGRADIHSLFLGGASKPKPRYHFLSYDKTASSWSVDVGQVHGVKAGNGQNTTIFAIFPMSADEQAMKNLQNAEGYAYVYEALPDKSYVSLEMWNPPRTTASFKVIITSIPIEPLNVFLVGDEAGIRFLQTEIRNAAQIGTQEEKVIIVNNITDATYTVLAKDNQYTIARSSDDARTPLVEQVPGYSYASAEKITSFLERMAKWEKILSLDNPASTLPSNTVEIQIFQQLHTGDEVPLSAGNDFVFHYSHPAEAPKFRLRLVNHGARKLYCALAYLSSQFDINTSDLFPSGGVWIGPGGAADVIAGQYFTASVADVWLQLGKNSVKESFKLIASTREFDSTLMEQPGINKPKAPISTRSTTRGGNGTLNRLLSSSSDRELSFNTSAPREVDDWFTSELTVQVVREKVIA